MTLRVGIVGSGNMASVHADAWQVAGDRVDIVFGGGRAERLAERFGARVADDLDELLGAVDVVDVCGPTDTHPEYVTAGAAAGVPVVCEKPLARNADGAREAVAACAAASVPLLVAHVVRFFPEYATARSVVAAGDIGDVAVIRLDRSTYLPAGASAWFSDRARSGGVVHDLMIHDVDYAAWVAGKVIRVYAKLAAGPGGADHAVASLRHERGAITHVQGSWAFPSGSFRTSIEIAGSEGLIGSRAAEPFRALGRDDADAPDIPAPPSTGESPYVAQIRHFSEVLHGRTDPRITPGEAASAVAVCDAIEESIASDRAVSIGRVS